jgi:Family of unknown function (DUF5677)
MNKSEHPVIFTPDNEPYLGRELLLHFDLLISSCLEQNTAIAPRTHQMQLSDAQKMACIVISQSINIALSIRELIRQGYLFGAKVLIRSLVERAMILLYLKERPEDIEKWKRGWQLEDGTPSLSKMFNVIQDKVKPENPIKGYEFTKEMNNMVHGKPDSAFANLVSFDSNRAGYAVSKILNRPDLCDDICAEILPWFVVIQGMMAFYFPNK